MPEASDQTRKYKVLLTEEEVRALAPLEEELAGMPRQDAVGWLIKNYTELAVEDLRQLTAHRKGNVEEVLNKYLTRTQRAIMKETTPIQETHEPVTAPTEKEFDGGDAFAALFG